MTALRRTAIKEPEKISEDKSYDTDSAGGKRSV